MRKAYRAKNNEDYWDKRWTEAGNDENRFKNMDIYPIKYAEMVKPGNSGLMLELGCGLGRVVKHYHREGIRIIGIERSRVAVQRMRQDDKTLLALHGDVMSLPFHDGAFDSVVAFGLYHNFEDGWQTAVDETARCLKSGGKFAVSIRPDNFEMRFNEHYWNYRQRKEIPKDGKKHFHKSMFGENEFKHILEKTGLSVHHVHRAKNVSMFWRLPFLREKEYSQDESQRRSGGYRLNSAGRFIDGVVTTLFPSSFCNVLVYVGEKS